MYTESTKLVDYVDQKKILIPVNIKIKISFCKLI